MKVIGLCEFLALAIITTLGVILFIKAGKTRRWVIGIIAVILVTLPILALLVAIVRPVVIRRSGTSNIIYTPMRQNWQPSSHHQFQADVYPSPQSAAAALSKQILQKLDTVIDDNVTARLIRIGGNVSPSALTAAANVTRNSVRSANVIIDHPNTTTTKPTANTLTLQLNETTVDSSENQATLTATLIGPAGQQQRNTIVSNKPWVEKSSKHGHVIGYSHQLCTTADQASAQAINDAATKLVPYVHNPRRFGKRRDKNWLKDQIAATLHTGQFIADRFTQNFDRPYGRVSRQAVLIDASRNSITQLTARLSAKRNATRTSVLQTVLSITGMVIVICLVYFFLNMATKGYYVWSLRLAAVVLLVVAGMLLLMV